MTRRPGASVLFDTTDRNVNNFNITRKVAYQIKDSLSISSMGIYLKILNCNNRLTIGFKQLQVYHVHVLTNSGVSLR